jgi:succinate dehydrogenase / fumarate reductase cytochrome b subunit
MRPAQFHWWSSIAKKLLTGLTGLGLMAFIIMHLAGNLTLLGGKDAFNAYTHKLHSLGVLVPLAELGLLALFAAHVVSAISVWVHNRGARGVRNAVVQSKGAPSRQSLSSRSMIITGSVLLIFTTLHVLQFRFGPAEADGYVAALGDEPVRDLHRLVVEVFKQPPFVLAYVAVMLLLGVHLRHGFWSALQSLGALNPRLRGLAYSAGVVFALVMAFGFLVLPIYVYLFAPAPGAGLAFVPRP